MDKMKLLEYKWQDGQDPPITEVTNSNVHVIKFATDEYVSEMIEKAKLEIMEQVLNMFQQMFIKE